jgi:polyferredoxin
MPETISNPDTLIRQNLAARIGHAMLRHQRVIVVTQWVVVALYIFLLFAPLFLALPDKNANITNNLRLFTLFLFWGIVWPLIMLSMMFFGRVWCGLFCPDGTLTEFISRHSRKQSIPRWIRWPGWPLTMLVLTTIYGQLVGVYEFHLATLLLLGLPTIAALWCGFSYGNGKRIWCMYLCPANGVFGLLAKISPLHFRVDEEKWKLHPPPLPRIDCPPLIDIRRMKSASACHACGRCSGYLEAVELAVRSPDSEILAANKVSTAEASILIFGILGVCTAAIQWFGSAWFAHMKSALAKLGFVALQQYAAPWWLLANYPEEGRIFTLFDGLSILIYVLGGGTLLGLAILVAIWLAAKIAATPKLSWEQLSLALVPIAGVGIVLGLSTYTITHLRQEGFTLVYAPYFQAGLLTVGSLFSLWLGKRLIITRFSPQQLLAMSFFSLPIALMCLIWTDKYFTSL